MSLNLKTIWARMHWQERVAWVVGTAWTALIIAIFITALASTNQEDVNKGVLGVFLAILVAALAYFAVGVPVLGHVGETAGWTRRRVLLTMSIVTGVFAVLLAQLLDVLIVYAVIAAILVWGASQAGNASQQ